MTTATRIDVESLRVGSVNASPIERDWSTGYAETWESYEAPECECGNYAEWDSDTYAWTCRNPECENNGGEVEDNGEGPMMNYAYPLEDLGQIASAPQEAASLIRDLPLCVIQDTEGGYWLALTGGGMDLSWEICEAYTRLGFLPPLHYADLPRMSGYPRDDAQRYVLEACKRSADVAAGWAQAIADRLARF